MSIPLLQILFLGVIIGAIWAYRRSTQGAARACPTCGRMVSPGAVACPQCGHRFGPNVGRMVVLAILIFLGFAALMLVLQEVAFNAKLDRLGR